MPQLRVVFDANVYRILLPQSLDELRARERAHSVIGLASYWTATELLTHMASPTDPDFLHCLGAIRRMVAHCSQYDGRRSVLRFIADTDDQLARMLFNRALPGRTREAEAYGRILGDISSAHSLAEWVHHQPAVVALAAHVDAEEKAFADSSFKHVVQTVVPGATSWNAIQNDIPARDKFRSHIAKPTSTRLVGALLVDKTAHQLEISLSPHIREAKIDHVMDAFPVPVRFYFSVLERIALNGYDLGVVKNVNSLWDFNFSFSTSANAMLDDSPVWVVTSDKAILNAANDCGARHMFKKLDEYTADLALEGDAFRDLVRSG